MARRGGIAYLGGMLVRRLAQAAVAGAAGLLASGSCYVSYCAEDCDPCFQDCKCKTVCTATAPGAPDGLRIHAVRIAFDGRSTTVDGIFGLRAAPGTDLVRHARAVLAANADLPGMPRAEGEWELLAIDRVRDGAVLHLQSGARVATLLYAADGGLHGLALAPAP